ncbi:MAG: hypothetical protein WA161_14135 [Pseudomonas sp.]|uniref:hypothetical protein n=1 Tax=Pseudomonas sp. TaxID=306 RepID=UPI003BB7453F
MNNLNEQKVWSAYQGDEVPVGEPMTLAQAQAVAAEHGLPGVGIHLTGGIHDYMSGGYKLTLVAFDFIGAGPDELSMFHGGIGFYWVPAYWAEQYADSPMLTPPEYLHYESAAFWFGTSPKFLACNGLNGDNSPLKPRWLMQLDRFKGWNKSNASNRPDLIPAIPAGGELLDLEGYRLSVYEHMLISGNGNKLDREGTLRGLLIKLLGLGVAQKDLLATLIATPPIWRICQSNWVNNPEGWAAQQIGIAAKIACLQGVV